MSNYCRLPKQARTPCRYPGGKSRATKTLFGYFPLELPTEYYEPFIGGGSMAIEFTRRYPHIPVTVSDYDPAVYAFWKTLRDSPLSLQEALLESKACHAGVSAHRELFERERQLLLGVTQDTLYSDNVDLFAIAHAFFVVNKCGFSGLMSAGFSELASISNFSVQNISRLEYYGEHIKDWRVHYADANSIIQDTPAGALVYLDPPYARVGKDGKSFIYGKDGDMHRSFDHTRFSQSMQTCKSNILLSYDNNELIKDLYPTFNHEAYSLTYTLHSGKSYREEQADRKELVLWNYETSHGSLESYI
jgi:site-specific DNA-adenine methylase